MSSCALGHSTWRQHAIRSPQTMHSVQDSSPVTASGIKRWLGVALRRAREDAQATQMAIVDAMRRRGAKTAASTVYRWEKGDTWPDDLPTTLAAYVEVTGRSERELLELAMRLWRENDEPPTPTEVADVAVTLVRDDDEPPPG